MGTVLVTGGAGFIGSHLCERLILEGNKVISFDNFNDFYDPSMKKNNINEIADTVTREEIDIESFLSVEGDIRDLSILHSLFTTHNIDTVVHLAAYAGVRPSIQNPRLYYDVNIVGSLNLLETIKNFGVKKFIFASSSSVYGNNIKVPFCEEDVVDKPISPYAASKKSGELMCHVYHHLYNINIACLRFFTVYGPRQRPDLAIRKFAELIIEDKEIPVYGDGTTERDYTFISDIIDGIVKSIDWVDTKEPKFGVFNLGESKTISLTKMIDALEGAIGKKAKKKNLQEQVGDVKKTFADISKSKRDLGYSPSIEFEEGIRVFVGWLLNKKDSCF